MDLDFAAQDLSDDALGGPVRVKDGQFVDSYGRTLSLRGFNVSGASKLPTEPNGLSHLTDGFYEHRTVTFVGRPFPLEEAPLQFSRLQAWGLPFVRLLVTWESIGHAGPNPSTDLDLEYIDYLRALVKLMPQYGIKCFVCAHQDVWSRFSGGSGAPGWTFEAAGLDIEAFTDTGTAYVHGQDEMRRAQNPINHKEPSGPFVWPSGYQKLAASTMATLFWAGDALAPNLRCRRRAFSTTKSADDLEDVSIQSYLQDAYIEAFGKLADELVELEACMGFEPMNEPHRGLINLHDFHKWNYMTDLHIGHCPSLAQSLALGSGYAQDVKYFVKSWPFPTRNSHHSRIDPQGRSVWLEKRESGASMDAQGMGKCVWRAHGVWEWDEKAKVARIRDKTYFDVDHRPDRNGRPIEWYRDCYGPFLQRFNERMARRKKSYMTFIEPIPNEFIPPWGQEYDGTCKGCHKRHAPAEKTTMGVEEPQNLIYAPHFYDLNVLFSKQHSFMSVNVQGLSRGMFILNALYFGSTGLRKNYRTQLKKIVKHTKCSIGRDIPIVIGEVGIPFDVNESIAFKTGDFDTQRQLMNALITGMEDNQLGFTLWNFNPHNRTEYGDGWNKEDFSVINGDEPPDYKGSRRDYRNQAYEIDELYSGGRVLDVIIRPYAVKIAGKQLRSQWDHRTLRYELEWQGSETPLKTSKSHQTDIFVPAYHYSKHKLSISVSDGDWTYNPAQQTLRIQQPAASGVSRYHLTIQLLDLQEHLTQRVALRRKAKAGSSILNYVPVDFEVWLEGVDREILKFVLLSMLTAVFAIIIGLLAI